jgi:cytidyltransferase-like protein
MKVKKLDRKEKCKKKSNIASTKLHSKRDDSSDSMQDSNSSTASNESSQETCNLVKEAEINLNEQQKSNKRDSSLRPEENYVLEAASYPVDPYFEDATFDVNKKYKIPKDRPVRIYCDGIYDLFHSGHARSLMQAKNLFENVYLMVGVSDDKSTVQFKGHAVMNEKERAESLRHCKYVDQVIEYIPWTITKEFIMEHKIDYVAHDDIPYSMGSSGGDVYAEIKKNNMFIPIKRTKLISTTEIITRILKDYDVFLRRQILRGVSKNELNISSFKESQVKIVEKITTELKDIKNEFQYAMRYWENFSQDFITSFASQFEKNKEKILEKIVNFVKNKKQDRSAL